MFCQSKDVSHKNTQEHKQILSRQTQRIINSVNKLMRFLANIHQQSNNHVNNLLILLIAMSFSKKYY